MVLVDCELLSLMTTNSGQNLLEISQNKTTLVVFLRHFGSQFCREAIDELSKLRPQLDEKGTDLVLIHMAEDRIAEDYFKKYNLVGVKHVSDPSCRFYAAFGLVKGSVTQIFALQSFIRGFTVQAKYGAEVNNKLGDNFQMPGVFIIRDGEIKERFIHKLTSDRPNYLKLISCKECI